MDIGTLNIIMQRKGEIIMKNKKNRFIVCLLSLVLCFMAGCGSRNNNNDMDNGSTNGERQTIQPIQHHPMTGM